VEGVTQPEHGHIWNPAPVPWLRSARVWIPTRLASRTAAGCLNRSRED